jgi:hypothetical protein
MASILPLSGNPVATDDTAQLGSVHNPNFVGRIRQALYHAPQVFDQDRLLGDSCGEADAGRDGAHGRIAGGQGKPAVLGVGRQGVQDRLVERFKQAATWKGLLLRPVSSSAMS